MGIWKAFFNNTRKPEGLLGKCMVGSMNHAHAALADWGLSHLPETGPAKIAELGCGGGRNIRALLRKYRRIITSLMKVSVKTSVWGDCRPTIRK